MKIGIVTVYNSMNYGAYLQAYAMKTLLEKKGHTVYFVKNNVRHPFVRTVGEAAYKLVSSKGKVKYSSYVMKKYSNYKRYWKNFSICPNKGKKFDELDCVIFGSDEIWNIKRKEINKYPVLFGAGFEDKYKIGFAPSMNDAKPENFDKYPEIVKLLKEFKYIAVRGKNSGETAGKLLNRKMEVVLDPTLLIDAKEYDRLEEKYDKKNYILLYSYGTTISPENKAKIQAYAKETGRKIVSVLSYLSWCDENPQLSVGELISCFKNSDMVFTNTFHGTILSTIFKKEFVSLAGDKKNKVTELLSALKLEDRILTKDKTVDEIVKTSINYNEVYGYLNKEKEYCNNLLNNALSKVKEGI